MADEQKPEAEKGNEVNRPMTEEEKKKEQARIERLMERHKGTFEKLAK